MGRVLWFDVEVAGRALDVRERTDGPRYLGWVDGEGADLAEVYHGFAEDVRRGDIGAIELRTPDSAVVIVLNLWEEDGYVRHVYLLTTAWRPIVGKGDKGDTYPTGPGGPRGGEGPG